MINYTIYENPASNQWVTFVHGAGGSSSIWFKQIRTFSKHFNVLLLDLRGHGDSENQKSKIKYTFKNVANDVLEVIDHLKIQSSHFIGISLGTIIIRQIAEMQPNRVKSMILGGAIMKMNFRSQILMKVGNIFKYVLPYLYLYKLFAFIIMPQRNHKESRVFFINEAKKLYQKEFIKWFRLTVEVNPLLRLFRQVEINIPTLYIMGEEDYMFLPAVQNVADKHIKSAKLFIIEQCGHVVNMEQPNIFNSQSIAFIKQLGRS